MSLSVVPGAPPAGDTFAFTLLYPDLTREAFERCGLWRGGTAPDRDDMISARRSLQLELATWANRGVNLWEQNSGTINLVQGTANYVLNAPVVSILDAWYSQPGTFGTEAQTDRYLWSMGRTEYAEFPNKFIQAPPTRYFFARTLPPTMTFAPTPEQAATVTVYYLRETADVTVAGSAGGGSPDMPQRFLEAACAGLALRLAVKFADRLPGTPEEKVARVQMLRTDAKAAWAEAALEDRETVPFYITPELGRYWRG